MNPRKICLVCLFALLVSPPPVASAAIEEDALEIMGFDTYWYSIINLTEQDVLSRFALYAENTLNFHDRAIIYPSSDENRLIWGNYVNIGSNAKTDTVIAGNGGAQGQGIWLRGGTIEGDAAVRGWIEKQSGFVTGEELTSMTIDMPTLDFFAPSSNFVSFPPNIQSQQWINVNPNDRPMSIQPDYYYGNVLVNSGGQLHLAGCGNYYFHSLVMNSDTVFRIEQTGCDTNVFIKTAFIWRGTLQVPEGQTLQAENLLWGVFGTTDNYIEQSLTGTIIAPDSKINLLCNKNLVGAIYAKNIDVFQDARIIARNGALRNIPDWESYVLDMGVEAEQVSTGLPANHWCDFDGFRIHVVYEDNGWFETIIPWEGNTQEGSPCESMDDAIAMDRCSIVDVRGFPRQNIKNFHIEINRQAENHLWGNVDFMAWYHWQKSANEWDGPVDPWDGGGPAAPGVSWVWRDSEPGAGPDWIDVNNNSVTQGDTWISPSSWPDNWNPGTEAVSGIGYYPEPNSFDLDLNQRLVAFVYRCCEWCEEDMDGYPETRIFRISSSN